MSEYTGFPIKTDIFEGPLDLLLHLVEKRKLFINDISLSNITDEYVSHVEKLGTVPIADRAYFIVIASTLLLVKSKNLLPTLDLSSEEQEEIGDLEKRLKILQKFREYSEYVKDAFGKNILFEPFGQVQQDPLFTPHSSITPESLHAALLSVISSFPQKEKTPHVTVKKIRSLEETIDMLAQRITRSLKMSFSDFSKHMQGASAQDIVEIKVTVIVGFLAMLELVKEGVIAVEQDAQYGEIAMESTKIGTPTYND